MKTDKRISTTFATLYEQLWQQRTKYISLELNKQFSNHCDDTRLNILSDCVEAQLVK